MSSPLLARSGLSLERLASFVAIADAGGLSAAAAGDPVHQSQLSRQLKELEEFFGAALIERRRGVFRLTAAGRGLLEIARTALTRLEDFARRCRAQLTEVHLGAGESALVWLVIPGLRSLLAGEPKLAFTLHNLQSEEITTRLRDGRLDFGVLRRAAVGAGLESVPVGEVEYALFVPRGAFPKGRAASAAQLLSRVPLALLEGSHATGEAVTAWAAQNDVRLDVRLRCTSLVQAATAVEQLGMGAILPAWAESALPARSVARLDLPVLRALKVPLRLVWSKRQAAVRPFLNEVARQLAAALHGSPQPASSSPAPA
jgi:DNA-binding transcriptional LysR family regulator